MSQTNMLYLDGLRYNKVNILIMSAQSVNFNTLYLSCFMQYRPVVDHVVTKHDCNRAFVL